MRLSKKTGLSFKAVYKWNWDMREQQIKFDNDAQKEKYGRLLKSSNESNEKKALFKITKVLKSTESEK